MKRARALGASFAVRCRRAALPAIAADYCLFDSFQRDCRYQIEQMPPFVAYEQSLRAMAMRESRRSYLTAFDARYRLAMSLCMLQALKAAFWDGWADKLQLRALYCERRPSASSRGLSLGNDEVRTIGSRLAKVAAKHDAQQTSTQWELFASQLFASTATEEDALWGILTSEPRPGDYRQTGT